MEIAKNKLRTIVQNYRIAYFSEYNSFKSALQKKINTSNNTLGKVGTGDDFIQRKIVELPENLFIMIKFSLDTDEFNWLFPDNSPSNEGIKWFAKTFPEFRAMEKL